MTTTVMLDCSKASSTTTENRTYVMYMNVEHQTQKAKQMLKAVACYIS